MCPVYTIPSRRCEESAFSPHVSRATTQKADSSQVQNDRCVDACLAFVSMQLNQVTSRGGLVPSGASSTIAAGYSDRCLASCVLPGLHLAGRRGEVFPFHARVHVVTAI